MTSEEVERMLGILKQLTKGGPDNEGKSYILKLDRNKSKIVIPTVDGK